MQLATLCYIKNDNKTLMLHRVKKENDIHEGKWNGLGGKFEPGETPEECVIREVKEESGLDIIKPKLHGYISFPAFDEIQDWFVFVFSAEEFSGDLIESSEGNLEWIVDNKLNGLNLWEGDKIFMKWMADDKLFSAKFIYKNKRLISHNVHFYSNPQPELV